MASAIPAQQHHNEVTGLMTTREGVTIKPGLSPQEHRETYSRLKQAIDAGYDSCVVLNSDQVYATKKINP